MNNTKPDYQLIYDMPSYGEGDTVDALEVLIETEDGTPQVPTEVCAQVKDAMGRTVHEWVPVIEPTGWVTLLPVRAEWRPGIHEYDMQYTLADGVRRRYVRGVIPITRGPSSC